MPEGQRALAQRLEEQTREIVEDAAELLHQRFDDTERWQEEQRAKLDTVLARVERSNLKRSEPPHGERGALEQLHDMERAMAFKADELREFLAHKGIRAVGAMAVTTATDLAAFLSSLLCVPTADP